MCCQDSFKYLLTIAIRLCHVYIFRYLYKVPLFVNEGTLYSVCEFRKRLFGWLRSNSFLEHSRNTRDRKKMMGDLRAQNVLTVQMTAYKACVRNKLRNSLNILEIQHPDAG